MPKFKTLEQTIAERDEALAYNAIRAAKREARQTERGNSAERYNRRVAMWARHKQEIAELKVRQAKELADL